MKKDFDKWNNKKKEIHNNGIAKLYHTREIWWCNLGLNIGAEQDGTGEEYDRPVLIIKGLSRQTCIIVPLTSSKEIHKMRISIGKVKEEDASAIISQIRVIDVKRLVEKIGFLNKDSFELITKTVKALL